MIVSSIKKMLHCGVFRIFLIIIIGIIFLLSIPVGIKAQPEQERSIRMTVVAVNPSETKTQIVPTKVYLPEEVTPDDILNLGGLNIEYDVDKSIYFLYSDNLELRPKETRTFQVELRDVWIYPQTMIDDLRLQTETVVSYLEATEYYENAKKLAESIYKALDVVVQTQSDETVSQKRHIGVYRSNADIIEEVRINIERLENILKLAQSRPVPEVLEHEKVKTESPTDTTTWMIIFIIMIFMGMLAGVFFFTWHTQARFTKSFIGGVRKLVFPKGGGGSQQEEDNM